MTTVSGIRRVAVIGAGPGGLAAAKYLAAEKSFSKIKVFEQRSTVGGVWCATPNHRVDDSFSIPRTLPSGEPTAPVKTPGASGFEFVSPIYDALDTNIPHPLMRYSDFEFPEGTALFPSHVAVREYLERYADDVRSHLSLGTQVLDVRRSDGGDGIWLVTSRQVGSGEESTEAFDGVVVANGHYDDPYIPDIPGIEEWNKAYPGAMLHSKFYRTPGDYKGKKVIIVGHSASGVDISDQIVPISQHPILISEREPSYLDPSDPTHLGLPEIAAFLVADRAVRFANGHIEHNIDSIIFCTGYMYSFPFLTSLHPPLVSDGRRTQNLYHQLFYHPAPTLSIIGLPYRIIPFPLSEAQASVVARVLAGRLALPEASDMQAWEDAALAEKGPGKAFHTLGYPADAAYVRFLHDWALEAETRAGLENGGAGKAPPFWDEELEWVRERTPLIKEAQKKLGPAEKAKVRSLKDLGFDFEKWKAEVGRDKQLL